MLSDKKKRILLFLVAVGLMIAEDLRSIRSGYSQNTHYWFSVALLLLLSLGLILANRVYRKKTNIQWLDRFLLLLCLICVGGYYFACEADKRFMLGEQQKLKEMVSDQKVEISSLNEVISGYLAAEERKGPVNDIRFPYSSNACYGMDVQELGGELLMLGFKNVRVLPNEHRTNVAWPEGAVTGITIDGKWVFSKKDVFSSVAEIVITYQGTSEAIR